MQSYFQLIMLAFLMEGIKAEDVAIIFIHAQEGHSHDTRLVMAPQQHHAARAQAIARRIERQLNSVYQGCSAQVIPASISTGAGTSQAMHMIQVQTPRAD